MNRILVLSSVILLILLAACGTPTVKPSVLATPVSPVAQPATPVPPTWTPTSTATLRPTSTPRPTATHTATPTSTPTATPTATPTPPFFPLAGRIMFLRERNLWAINVDGSEEELLTRNEMSEWECFSGADLASPAFGFIIYASRSPFKTDTANVIRAPIDAECSDYLLEPAGYGCESVVCRCFGFKFSPDYRKLAYVYISSDGHVENRIVDLGDHSILTYGSYGVPYDWLASGYLIFNRWHCEGTEGFYWDPDTRSIGGLGATVGGDWNPAHTAFVTTIQPYQGPKYLAGYDFEHKIGFSVPEDKKEHPSNVYGYVGSAFWAPTYDSYLYTSAVVTFTSEYNFDDPGSVGPRGIWVAYEDQVHTCLACDSAFNYDALGRVDDSVLIRKTPYSTGFDHYLDIYNLCNRADCSQAQYYLINWQTGEWSETPLTIPPTPEPAPDLAATPVYIDPSGAWSLVPGMGSVGLWRVFADGRPAEVVLVDGSKFFWISPE
ncbi:MAG: hypothetical protein JXA21_30290 [Anaerolineae bacterium]|nr:hypothetical protein [Anaerolineae bacterium]